MSNPTPTTLRETLDKFMDDLPFPDDYEFEKEIKNRATQSIREQLKALLPEKKTVNKGDVVPDIYVEVLNRAEGSNQAIQEIEKAIEEWAK